jgi:endonuclease/exonuclease/phosphatase family metal-dependent hydrolase
MKSGRSRAAGRAVAGIVALAAVVATSAELGLGPVVAELEFAVDLVDPAVPLGGLSGAAWDPACGLLYAVSDDRGQLAAPRVYALSLELEGGSRAGWLETLTLLDADGEPFERGIVDAEAVALAPDGVLWVATEGVSHELVPPRIIGFRLDGSFLTELSIPPAYLPGEGTGVRSNHGFEGLSVTPDGARIVAAVESSLHQDGPEADLGRGSVIRLAVFDRATGGLVAERAYAVEPVPDAPRPAGAYRSTGVSEILALDDRFVLVMERSFSAGVGNRVRLFVADLESGDDVTGATALGDDVRPVDKRLLADLEDLGIDPDNLEGLSFGPPTAEGRPTLLLLADNNFQPEVERNQLLVVALDGVEPPPRARRLAGVGKIQGADHTSPLVGRCVDAVEATVTAVLGQRAGQAFFVQAAPDGDPATSDGLLVTAADGLPEVAVGDAVRLAGRVGEPHWGAELPVTRLVADRLEISGHGVDLPPPVVLGAGGRSVPGPAVDDDGLSLFEPERDAVDFYESLEGMRVRVEEPVVVGPTSRHGELVVLGDDGAGSAPRSGRGGVVLRPDNAHPARIVVDDRLTPDPPAVAVGDRLAGPVDGVLHYSYGSFKLLNTEPLVVERPSAFIPASTSLVADRDRITVVTFNVENLSAVSQDGKIAAIAGTIVDRLRSPTVLALQEIQDDSGPEDDGTVTAERTLARLVEAVVAAGGPRYRRAQVDPEDNADGGQPGANIRVALLFDPARVSLAATANSRLPANPTVLGAGDPAFAASRKPLVVELVVDGRPVVFVVCHLRSKGGDDPLFGRFQPSVPRSEKQRIPQAELIRRLIDVMILQDEGSRVVILGDLNDFELSRSVGVLAAPPMVNLVERLPVADRSTYVYQGLSQTLDHVIVSPALAVGAEIEVVHGHADLPADRRASDHDPVVARFRFGD